MCQSVILKDSRDIGSIQKFQDYFKIGLMQYIDEVDIYYIPGECLCGINIDKFFIDNPQYKFIYKNGDWWEID